MKIGLLTFHSALNFGAQLQTFALVQILKKLGAHVEIICYEPKYLNAPYRFFRNVDIDNGVLSVIKQVSLHLLFDIYPWIKYRKKYRSFQNKFFDFSSIRIYKSSDLEITCYDVIIVGSDQIWNPEITSGRVDDIYTLYFKQNKKLKKVSYAASLSDKYISEDQLKLLAERINDFYAVSVREYNVKEVLRRYTGKKIEVVADPTLLISKEQWMSYIPQNQIIKDKYVLLYQARGNHKMLYDKSLEFADKYGYKLYDASGLNYRLMHNSMQAVSPIELLNLIYYAEVIITVSFHGTAMSVILEKPFFSFVLNDGRDDRVINLLKSINLESQIVTSESSLNLNLIDYLSVRMKLEKIRKESIDFLEHSLM